MGEDNLLSLGEDGAKESNNHTYKSNTRLVQFKNDTKVGLTH